jgi:hypothetical protein
MCLTFYSQNCFGLPIKNKSQRFKNILTGILDNKYDVIFLQEIFSQRDLNLFLEYLEGDYYVIYSQCRKSIGGGLVLLIKKELLKNSEYKTDFVKFKSPGLFSLYSYEEIFCRGKGFLYFYIKSLDLYFVNVHCLNVFCIPILEKSILKQLEELSSFLEGKRCFVGGDFNLSLRDSFFEKQNNINLTPDIGTYRLFNKQVDYILSANLDRAEIFNHQPHSISIGSDHLGLVSRVELLS